MQDFQRSDQISNQTLTKLLEVDSELSAQEAELTAHLKAVQEKRNSLKTVISLFGSTDTSAVSLEDLPEISPTELTSQPEVVENLAIPQIETLATTVEESGTQPEAPQPEAPTKPRSGRRNKTPKAPTSTRTTRKSQGWQQYTREKFGKIALPEVISTMLQSQPNQVFEISAIVDEIFVDEMPLTARNKARDRVSNILSEGTRKHKWYRGKSGCYSLSKAAAVANYTS